MTRDEIRALFTCLGEEFTISSSPDPRYNCIAWALGETGRWWHPSAGSYWPPGVPRLNTFAAWRAMLRQQGFEPTDSEAPEPGVERLALFAKAGRPTHLARQLASGRWTSKLGPDEDIEHSLHGLAGVLYGEVTVLFRRPDSRSAASSARS